ncbi:MAG: DUF1127 domain-containing protein [Kiloniellales bacterium]
MSIAKCDPVVRYAAEGSGNLDFAPARTRIFFGARETVRQWYRRATIRPQLARLKDRQLNDIGLTRAEAEYEAAKPFWRA